MSVRAEQAGNKLLKLINSTTPTRADILARMLRKKLVPWNSSLPHDAQMIHENIDPQLTLHDSDPYV